MIFYAKPLSGMHVWLAALLAIAALSGRLELPRARQTNIAVRTLSKKFRSANLIATKGGVSASAIKFAAETEDFLFASGSGGGTLLGGAQSR